MTCMQPPDDAEQRLTRLLALKRHEVPPPGFFDQLPARILVNLRAGSEIGDAPWWLRAWRSFTREPMIGLSYAALGMGAVVFGISVLETAIDTRAPVVGPSQGLYQMTTQGSGMMLGDPFGENPGLIYRVGEPTPANWYQTGPIPGTSPFTRGPIQRVDGPVWVPVPSVLPTR